MLTSSVTDFTVIRKINYHISNNAVHLNSDTAKLTAFEALSRKEKRAKFIKAKKFPDLLSRKLTISLC